MDIEARLTRASAFVRVFYPSRRIRAVTVPNDDGTFDIFVNGNLSSCTQISALEHELNHIERDHFYNDIKEIETIEAEADLVLVFN